MVLKMKDFFLFKAEQGYIVPTHIHHALYFPIYLLVDYLGYLGLSWLSWTIKIHILAAKINVIKKYMVLPSFGLQILFGHTDFISLSYIPKSGLLNHVCGGLKENGPQREWCYWGCGFVEVGMTLLEEVCHYGGGL